MCKAKPHLRCETHAVANLKKAQDALARWEAEASVFARLNEPVPAKVNTALNRAKTTLMEREQERLELLFHQSVSASADLLLVEQGTKKADDYTKKARAIYAEVEQLKKTKPQYASLIASISRNRENAGRYIDHGTLPDTNEEIVEMMELINSERTSREKQENGKWLTTPQPLTADEEKIKEEAEALLRNRNNEPTHVRLQREAAEREAKAKEAEEAKKAKQKKTEQAKRKPSQPVKQQLPPPVVKTTQRKPVPVAGTTPTKPAPNTSVPSAPVVGDAEAQRKLLEEQNRERRLKEIDRTRRANELKAKVEAMKQEEQLQPVSAPTPPKPLVPPTLRKATQPPQFKNDGKAPAVPPQNKTEEQPRLPFPFLGRRRK